MGNFSKVGEERLATCHVDLQLIMHTAVRISNVDFGIAEGHRSVELQQQYFKEGKSKIDGITTLGKHNYTPSKAADIYAWVNNAISYDKETLSYLAGLIHGVADMLFEQGKITHKIRWGGNWNDDGTILLGQSLVDRPHYELIET
jgi:peptidoglycan L-alanyl-D-glutamate endopeptidase CwlK